MFQITRPGCALLPVTWSCGPTVTKPVPICHPLYPPSFQPGAPKSFV